MCGCSFLRTVFWGYFFSIHLLHIANFSQLLKRAILAITKNGKFSIFVFLTYVTLYTSMSTIESRQKNFVSLIESRQQSSDIQYQIGVIDSIIDTAHIYDAPIIVLFHVMPHAIVQMRCYFSFSSRLTDTNNAPILAQNLSF